jgi:hypothetical protein
VGDLHHRRRRRDADHLWPRRSLRVSASHLSSRDRSMSRVEEEKRKLLALGDGYHRCRMSWPS